MRLDLQELARTNPPATDAVAIELVSSIAVAGDILRFKSRRGVLGRLIDRFSTSRDFVLHESFGTAITALGALFADLERDVTLSDLAVARVAGAVAELQEQTERLAVRSAATDAALQQLAATTEKLRARVDAIEHRLTAVELHVAARDTVDRALAAWIAGRTYAGLPWLLQVVLLAREICSSRAVAATLSSDRGRDLERYFLDSVTTRLASSAPASFSLASAIDDALGQLDEDRLVVFLAAFEQAGGARTAPEMAALALGARLRLVAPAARPEHPAWCGIELLRGEGIELSYTTRLPELAGVVLREWRGAAERAFGLRGPVPVLAAASTEQRLLEE